MINVPVFSDENGTPHINIYIEDEDGTFRRTQSEPLRLLRDDIKGISISQGDIVSPTYDRYERQWNSPTVTFHYGRPQSFYQFLRGKVLQNRFFVFTKPQLAGHISRLTLHELQLKNSTSQRKLAILKEKYIEALELWSEEELEKKTSNAPSAPHVSNSSNLQPYSEMDGRADISDETDTVTNTDKVTYFRRDKLPRETPSRSSMKNIPAFLIRNQNPVEQDFNKRKNLIREFSLSPQPSVRVEQKVHNRHFFKRFIFSLD